MLVQHFALAASLAIVSAVYAQCRNEQPSRIPTAARWIAGGEHLWVCSDDAGIRQFEIDASDQPVEIGWIPTDAPPLGGIEIGDALYVATANSLKVLDLTANGREIAQVDFGNGVYRVLPQGLATNGRLLAVPTTTSLRFFNIQNPSNPIDGGSLSLQRTAYSFSGDHLATSNSSGLFELYDVAAAPVFTRIAQTLLDQRGVTTLVLQDDKLTAIDSTIRVYDIADPTAPTRVLDTPTYQGNFTTSTRISRSGKRFAIGSATHEFDADGVPLITQVAYGSPARTLSAVLPRHTAYANGGVLEVFRNQEPRPPVVSRVHIRRPNYIGWAAVAEVEIVPEPGVTYQWTVDGSFVGETTSPRLVGPPLLGNLSAYTCRITNACGSSVATAYFFGVCPSDYNQDGRRHTPEDIEAFITDFEAGNPIADVNGDEFIDFFDYAQFLDAIARCS